MVTSRTSLDTVYIISTAVKNRIACKSKRLM